MYGCNLSVIDGTEIIVKKDDTIIVPEEFSYMGNLPKVLNQGSNPICIPCSISSYIDWEKSLDTGIPESCGTDLMEIYDSKKTEGEGMDFKEAFSFLRHNGVHLENGELYKIKNYAKVNSFFLLRQSIIANGPCLAALPVYETNGRDDFWSDEYSGKLLGFHAVSFIGYNKDGIIFRNSWGNGYGKKGYNLLPEKDFDKVREVWTILN